MISEFQAIERFFQRDYPARADIYLGTGDDAAVLAPQAEDYQVLSTDTLVNQVHILDSWPAADIAYRALAVNLSDLAAMGATPRWALLSMTLPQVDEAWLAPFAQGFFALADVHDVALIGGNMTRGPLSISVTIGGEVALPHKPLRRAGAQAGDDIYVTGQLGAAALALLDHTQKISLSAGDKSTVYQQWLRPAPQVLAGQLLLPMASAAIDVSDGLAQDLTHLLKASGVGAELQVAKLPIAPQLSRYLSATREIQLALTGGDDYQLCFTIPPSQRTTAEHCFTQHNINLTRIGVITAEPGLQWVQADQTPLALTVLGYQHWVIDNHD
jgi:thiamine-monophosphate kinase